MSPFKHRQTGTCGDHVQEGDEVPPDRRRQLLCQPEIQQDQLQLPPDRLCCRTG